MIKNKEIEQTPTKKQNPLLQGQMNQLTAEQFVLKEDMEAVKGISLSLASFGVKTLGNMALGMVCAGLGFPPDMLSVGLPSQGECFQTACPAFLSKCLPLFKAPDFSG